MSRQAGVTLFQIGLATPASSLVQIILCIGYFLMFHRKLRKAELMEKYHFDLTVGKI